MNKNTADGWHEQTSKLLDTAIPTNVQKMSANIFGWELYRVYRDEHNEIIRIELVKDNIVREFTFDGEKRLK